jgi:hypothetical protein
MGLRETELGDEGVHRLLAPDQDVQDLAPPGFGDRVERIRGGSGSGHESIIYLYGYTSSVIGNRLSVCELTDNG